MYDICPIVKEKCIFNQIYYYYGLKPNALHQIDAIFSYFIVIFIFYSYHLHFCSTLLRYALTLSLAFLLDTVGVAAGNQNIISIAVPWMRGFSRETETTITPAQEKLCQTSGRRTEKPDRKRVSR